MKAVTNVVNHERHVISEEMVICKFLLVNPATSATGERAFSKVRRVILLRRANIMNQQKFYHVTILQTNKTSTDKIWLVDVAIEVA